MGGLDIAKRVDTPSRLDAPETKRLLIEIAEVIALKGSPQTWLISALEIAAASVTTWQQTERMHLSRAQMRKRLEEIQLAAEVIKIAIQTSSIFTLIDTAASERIEDTLSLWKYMQDLESRAKDAAANIRLGGGRDKVKTTVDGLSAMQACASVIYEAWHFARHKSPGLNHPDAQRAAELLWRATGGAASGKSEENERWRDHLEKARNTNGLWRHLIRQWLSDAHSQEHSPFQVTSRGE